MKMPLEAQADAPVLHAKIDFRAKTCGFKKHL
jgi:hypothetical protein